MPNANILPNQNSLSIDDVALFEQLKMDMVDYRQYDPSYVNVQKQKLPPKIPIESIVRKKNKQDNQSIKDFSERTKKSGSSDQTGSNRDKQTPSSEKRLSEEKTQGLHDYNEPSNFAKAQKRRQFDPDVIGDESDDFEDALDPFTDEQKNQMKEIMGFSTGPKKKIEETKKGEIPKKAKTDSSTKSSNLKGKEYGTEGGFIIPNDLGDRGHIGDYYHQFIKDTGDKKGKSKKKKLTTESSSELSETTPGGKYSKPNKKKSGFEDEWDNGGIKFVDAQEQVIKQGRQPFSDDEIRETFRCFDLNGNGYIGAAEIKYVLEQLEEDVTDEEIDEMIRMLDLDGDGQVNFKEFYKMATGQSLAPIGVALPPALDKDELKDENLDFIKKIRDKNMKKKPSSSGFSSSSDSSSSTNTIKREKRKALQLYDG